LRRSADFDRVLRSGRRIGTASLTLFVRDNENGFPRVGLAVGRKLGKAVVRNRIKRRLRALVRPLAGRSQAGRDVVIVAKPPAIAAAAARLRDEVQEAWEDGVER
jgi:ribonuclease P protein component